MEDILITDTVPITATGTIHTMVDGAMEGAMEDPTGVDTIKDTGMDITEEEDIIPPITVP